MEVDDSALNIRLRGVKSQSTPLLPEVDCYLHLLVLLYLLDAKMTDSAVACSELLMTKLSSFNRRTLSHISGRCYYYHTLSYEAKGDPHFGSIRPFLHGKLRTATLNVSQSVEKNTSARLKFFTGQLYFINIAL